MPLNVGLEKDVEYNIDVEFDIQVKNNRYTCTYQHIINTSTHENEWIIFKAFLTIRYINIDISKTTEDNTYCCIFCKCVEDNKHIFKNKVLISRIHKCKIVDILTETQYIAMYERIEK